MMLRRRRITRRSIIILEEMQVLLANPSGFVFFVSVFGGFISQPHILCQLYCHLVTWSLFGFLWS